MNKRKIVLIFTLILTIIIGMTVSLVFQNETDQELEQRIRSAMEMARKNPDIFNQIDNQLKANGYNIVRGSGLEFTRKDGLNILIEIPMGKNIKNLEVSKREIKKIVSKIIKSSIFDNFGISVKVVVVNTNDYSS